LSKENDENFKGKLNGAVAKNAHFEGIWRSRREKYKWQNIF
jgi:hypothetical protein